MKCQNEQERNDNECGIWDGTQWICWTEYESLRQCYHIKIDLISWNQFIKKTRRPTYKIMQDEISSRIKQNNIPHK